MAKKHGTVEDVNVADIEVSKLRHRGDAADTSDLQASMAEHGQLQPIVLTTTGKLLAGWRRLTSAKALGWPTIQVKYVNATGIEEGLIEYTENSARKSLTWQEESLAIRGLHNELCGLYPEWTPEQTSETLCVSLTHVQTMLRGAEYYLKHPDKCAKMTFKDVMVKIRHAARQQKETILGDIENAFLDKAPVEESAEVADALGEQVVGTEPKPAAETSTATHQTKAKTNKAVSEKPNTPQAEAEKPVVSELFNYHFAQKDCYEFAKSWKGKPFNFLHLDPPYGMNVNGNDNQQSTKASIDVTYSDTEADFQKAIDFWIANPPANAVNLDYCTAVVWHNPDTWPKLKAAAIAGGWQFMPFPFVAHKTNNSGVIPNPATDFRRTYETAMFLYRGTQVIQNVAASVGVSFTSKGIHTTEKPVAALQHIFRGLLFSRARVLDPFCGSGSSLVALMEFHTRVDIAIGLELEPKFFAPAEEEVRSRYNLLKASQAASRKRLETKQDHTPKEKDETEFKL